eukprot:10360282-Karenia_brevis.AAC.1
MATPPAPHGINAIQLPQPQSVLPGQLPPDGVLAAKMMETGSPGQQGEIKSEEQLQHQIQQALQQ